LRPDLEKYYLIDQYLENKLKDKELSAFENQVMQDKTFASEIEEQRMLNGLILEAELKAVRTQIEKDLSSIQQPSFFRTHWKWIGVGLFSISSILYYAISTKDTLTQSVQESTVDLNENKSHSEVEAAVKTEKPNRISTIAEPNKPATNTISLIEVTKPKDRVETSDSIHLIKNTETIAPKVSGLTTINNAPKIETKSTEAAKIDCSLIKIIFSVTTETSCANTETGALHIEKITGGVAPYSFTLNNKKIKQNNIFELGAGTYEVKISDKNGCSTEQRATILEKNCASNLVLGEKFNINPTIGETCSIPFNTDKKGNLTIYNRSGKIILKATNPSSDYVEWNGTDVYGALAEAGLYVYIIEYTDGIKVTGEVNIIR
jgi:hypothetical protein